MSDQIEQAATGPAEEITLAARRRRGKFATALYELRMAPISAKFGLLMIAVYIFFTTTPLPLHRRNAAPRVLCDQRCRRMSTA